MSTKDTIWVLFFTIMVIIIATGLIKINKSSNDKIVIKSVNVGYSQSLNDFVDKESAIVSIGDFPGYKVTLYEDNYSLETTYCVKSQLDSIINDFKQQYNQKDSIIPLP